MLAILTEFSLFGGEKSKSSKSKILKFTGTVESKFFRFKYVVKLKNINAKEEIREGIIHNLVRYMIVRICDKDIPQLKTPEGFAKNFSLFLQYYPIALADGVHRIYGDVRVEECGFDLIERKKK